MMIAFETILESTNWITVVLTATVLLVTWGYFQWSQAPPGPLGIPYLGYYPFLSGNNYPSELLKLSKKYGEVYCFRVTGQLYAHVADMKIIREIGGTKSDYFDSRPSNFNFFQDIFGGGVFQLNGEPWKVTRKFFVRQFKEFGMGKKVQEGYVQDSLKNIVDSLNKGAGKNFNGLKFFSNVANDVMCHMIFGAVKLDDDDIRDFHEAYRIATEFSIGTRILLAGPLLKYILIPFVPGYRRYQKNKEQMDFIISKIIRQQERTFDRNNIRNLVDAFINERKLLEESNDQNSQYFTEYGLARSILQFIGDGALGTSWLVSSVLSVIASRPDIQKAIQSEVDEVVGRNRVPAFDDRSRLSYTNAVVYEGLRTADFFPVLPTVQCTKDTTIAGCHIPKGTIVAFNMWGVFHNPNVYDEPEKFDPTRFLSVNGKKPRCEIPAIFGVGKRSCIGESLVSLQLTLYMATVLQNFDLHPADETAGLKRDDEEWKIMLRATTRVP